MTAQSVAARATNCKTLICLLTDPLVNAEGAQSSRFAPFVRTRDLMIRVDAVAQRLIAADADHADILETARALSATVRTFSEEVEQMVHAAPASPAVQLAVQMAEVMARSGDPDDVERPAPSPQEWQAIQQDRNGGRSDAVLITNLVVIVFGTINDVVRCAEATNLAQAHV